MMYQHEIYAHEPGEQLLAPHEVPRAISLPVITQILRRRWRIVVWSVMIAITLVLMYLALAPSLYTASVYVMMDPPRGLLFQQGLSMEAQLQSVVVDSQIEIIKSDEVTKSVVRRLGLGKSSNCFDGAGCPASLPARFFRSARSVFSFFKTAHQVDPERRAIGELLRNIVVKRVGLTHAIGISYTARSPEQAAQGANAIAEVYISSEEARLRSANARIITRAYEPLQKSSPKSVYLLAFAAFAGSIFGIGGAFLIEVADTRIRRPEQIQESLGISSLGALPFLSCDGLPDAQIVGRHVIDQSSSAFAEGIRNIKVSADIDLSRRRRQHRVVGIVSGQPGAGSTSVASNLSILTACAGDRTLLIDGNLRAPDLSRRFVPAAITGLADVLLGRARAEDVVWVDPVTGLHILPAANALETDKTEMVSSGRLAKLLASLSESYSYVFVDLPPLAPLVDVKAVSEVVDGFVLVVECGRTSPFVIRRGVEFAGISYGKLIGAVLNKMT